MRSPAQRASAVFEAGRVLLPEDAPWAAEYRRELLGFPGGRHDDQVDSTTQVLIWAEERPKPRPPVRIGLVSIPNPPGAGPGRAGRAAAAGCRHRRSPAGGR